MMPRSSEREAQAFDEKARRVVDAGRPRHDRPPAGTLPLIVTRASRGSRAKLTDAADSGAPVVIRLIATSSWPGGCSASPTGAPAVGPGRQAHDGDVLVVAERAGRRGVAVGQIVPRPARAEPFVVERVVVADEPAVDAMDARRVERVGPLEEQPAAPASCDPIDGSPPPIDDEIAAEHAVRDRAGGLEPRFVAEVPAEPLAATASVTSFMFDAGTTSRSLLRW